MTLRRSGSGLNDVVVRGVEMFRAEMLNDGHLWFSCYLSGTGVESDRVTFEVVACGDRLEFEVGEMPTGSASVATD